MAAQNSEDGHSQSPSNGHLVTPPFFYRFCYYEHLHIFIFPDVGRIDGFYRIKFLDVELFMPRALFSLSLLSERGANGNEAAPVEGMAAPHALPTKKQASRPPGRWRGRENVKDDRVRVGDALQRLVGFSGRLVRPGRGHLASCYQQPVGPRAFRPGARGVCGDAQSYLLQIPEELLQLVPVCLLTGPLGQ